MRESHSRLLQVLKSAWHNHDNFLCTMVLYSTAQLVPAIFQAMLAKELRVGKSYYDGPCSLIETANELELIAAL